MRAKLQPWAGLNKSKVRPLNLRPSSVAAPSYLRRGSDFLPTSFRLYSGLKSEPSRDYGGGKSGDQPSQANADFDVFVLKNHKK